MLKVTGYVDKWNGSAGDRLTFHVSASTSTYEAELVRLINGDPNPAGPGVKEVWIDHPLNGMYPGKEQAIHIGSCMIVDRLPEARQFAVTAAFMPTLLTDKAGTLLSITLSDDMLITVALDREALSLQAGVASRAIGPRLMSGQWYELLLQIDLELGSISVRVRPARFQHGAKSATLTMHADVASAALPQSLIFGASSCTVEGRQHIVSGPFNGRVADPKYYVGVLAEADQRAWQNREPIAQAPAIAWDFAANAGADIVADGIDGRFNGLTVNRPTRLVAGPSFEGQAQRATDAPHLFNAIHFHDDDLADAGWEPSFTLSVPQELRSGFYAFKLTAGDSVDYVPFFITPAKDAAVAPLAMLVPTVSYQVYANLYAELDQLPPSESPLRDHSIPETPEEAYVRAHRLLSCYDVHSDGSGVCMSSILRPMPIFVRPSSVGRLVNSEHQLSADLYLIDWLETKNIPYDVITEHELHGQGKELLSRYRAVVSGTHSEYWTGAMLDGLKAYTDDGGRFICLAGNALYWATALSEDGTIAEVRRDHGLRAWTGLPCETQLSLDGSMGGVWRDLGRAPNHFTGLGFTSMGFGSGRPYTRSEASRTSRAAFLFDGIDEEEIGDFPSLIAGYGAAGLEFDRADMSQGTPAHALILATATGFSDLYQLTVDEVVTTSRFYGGTMHPDVRADIVFYETPKGGAVFSAGSISWCGGLSYNDYHNSVSRLTENVVRCFSAESLPPAIAGKAVQ